MIAKLTEKFSSYPIVRTSSTYFYIVDLKDINGGGVELIEYQPAPMGVVVLNPPPIPVAFLGFQDNAFVPLAGQGVRHCECVLFPEACNNNDWILFVETKYADNIENAFRASREYPLNMINQIISTVAVFRDQGIIEPNRRVWAIVSFPKLIEDFAAFFFTGQISIEDMLLNYKIVIKATNSAEIISPKRIKLI